MSEISLEQVNKMYRYIKNGMFVIKKEMPSTISKEKNKTNWLSFK